MVNGRHSLTIRRAAASLPDVKAKSSRKPESSRPVGRPPAHEGRLALWIKRSGMTRLDAAKALVIGRKYLDNLCREIRRPSLELAVRIDELTGHQVPLSYLVKLPKSGRQ
jgi:hypothetical protein